MSTYQLKNLIMLYFVICLVF